MADSPWQAILRHRFLLAVLLAHGALWAAAGAFVSPHPDYIDHWVTSRVWSLSYFEHPPMVAWVIKALVAVVGSSDAGLRAAALLMNLALLALIYAFTARRFGLLAGKLTLLGLETTVFFTSKSLSLQTEQPLVLFWVAALWAWLNYLDTGRARWILAAGALAGLGALSKYTMVLFYLGLLAYALLVRGRRRELANPWQYAGGLLALAVFLPVLIWNYQHDWVSFRFQLSKGGADPNVPFGLSSANFLLGTAFFYSPVLFVWGLWRMGRALARDGLADGAQTLLAVLTFLPLLFFAAAVARSEYADPHWGVLSAVCLLAWLGKDLAGLVAAGRGRRVAMLIGAALAVNVALLGLVAAHTWRPFLPIVPDYDPTRQVVGWREAGVETEALLARNGLPAPRYVLSYFYALGSQFALHLPSQPLPYSFSRERRNVWVNPAEVRGDNAFVVCEGDGQGDDCRWMRERMRERFGWPSLKALGTVQPVVWGTPRQKVTVLVRGE
jgi:4-amino-4-deoxy-L-arabinose transferase-like glycosyltransferase